MTKTSVCCIALVTGQPNLCSSDKKLLPVRCRLTSLSSPLWNVPPDPIRKTEQMHTPWATLFTCTRPITTAVAPVTWVIPHLSIPPAFPSLFFPSDLCEIHRITFPARQQPGPWTYISPAWPLTRASPDGESVWATVPTFLPSCLSHTVGGASQFPAPFIGNDRKRRLPAVRRTRASCSNGAQPISFCRTHPGSSWDATTTVHKSRRSRCFDVLFGAISFFCSAFFSRSKGSTLLRLSLLNEREKNTQIAYFEPLRWDLDNKAPWHSWSGSNQHILPRLSCSFLTNPWTMAMDSVECDCA